MEYFDLAIVFDKNQIIREGLVKVLSESGCKTTLGFGRIDEINAADIEQTDNVLFLVDPGKDDHKVNDWVASLSEQHPNSRIVVFSHSYSDTHMAMALEGGAAAYLLTNIGCEEFVKSLEVIALGGHVVPDQALQHFANYLKERSANAKAIPQPNIDQGNSSFNLLSNRELDILRSVSQGMSNKLIARQWNITEATVKVHVKAILRKIGAKNRTEAAYWAWYHGLQELFSSANGSGTSSALRCDDAARPVADSGIMTS